MIADSPTRNLPTIDNIRSKFPALGSGFAFLENAGGSQVPQDVADAIRDYMLTSYVQLGAGYPASKQATDLVTRAHAFVNEVVNGTETGRMILGPSCTQLCYMLAECYSRVLSAGDEVIIAETAHEANAGPWAKLERFGIKVKVWKVEPETFACPLDGLKALFTNRTKLVAFPHVSNLLGEIVDVEAITKAAHEAGARVVVDGVAYAPHRAIDVKKWDVDWYVYSTYKVFGPHMGALYGKADAVEELVGPNHFFIPNDDIYKFELGGVSHEGAAGLLGLQSYLEFLSGRQSQVGRAAIEDAFEVMTQLELPLQEQLVGYLRSKTKVRIIGPAHGGASRVPTISFVHETLSSPDIVAHVDSKGVGIRYGHMYAYRLCEAIGIDVATGVVRASMVHYNTTEEVGRLISALDEVL